MLLVTCSFFLNTIKAVVFWNFLDKLSVMTSNHFVKTESWYKKINKITRKNVPTKWNLGIFNKTGSGVRRLNMWTLLWMLCHQIFYIWYKNAPKVKIWCKTHQSHAFGNLKFIFKTKNRKALLIIFKSQRN